MKYLLILMVLSLFLTGCFELMVTKSYVDKEVYNAYIGDIILYEETTQDAGLIVKKISKFELLYNGKTKSTINITYREYFGYCPPNGLNYSWLVKDGFTQQLNYDLDASKIINYKGRIIEILEVNSDNSIRYTVN